MLRNVLWVSRCEPMTECNNCGAFMDEEARFEDFGETEIRFRCPNCRSTKHKKAW